MTTPATSEADVEITDKDGNTLVTDAMLKEEEKMQEETEKETAKVMQEEVGVFFFLLLFVYLFIF